MDIRVFLEDGKKPCMNPTKPEVKDEPVDKMQMIRNKMVESRRAMERDQAKEDRGEPVRRWDKGVTLAKDVLNKFVQDQTKITVVGADVEALYPNLADAHT